MFKTVNRITDISKSWEGNLLRSAIKELRKGEQTEEEVLQTLIKRTEEMTISIVPHLSVAMLPRTGEERLIIDRINRQFHYSPGMKKAVYDAERLRQVIEMIKHLLFEQLKDRPKVFFVVSYSFTWHMPSLAIEEDGKTPPEEDLEKMAEHIKFALRYYGYEYVTETVRNPFYVLYFREIK